MYTYITNTYGVVVPELPTYGMVALACLYMQYLLFPTNNNDVSDHGAREVS